MSDARGPGDAGEAARPVPIPIARPCFDAEEQRRVAEVIASGWVTQGPCVAEFEERFAAATGAAQAVAVSSCSSGLFLALHALGIGAGDEVLVPSLSFIATANAVVHARATPVFVDVDPRTYNITAEIVEAAITPATRAVVVVHQLGLPADLDPIQAVASRHGLAVIEDAACAVGAQDKGRPVGASGNLTAFSFHPRKLLVTGEGGMLTLEDSELAARLRRLRHQGMSVSDMERHRARQVIFEDYPEVGYNFRMSDIAAAVGLAQLDKLERFLDERRVAAARYDELLGGRSELRLPYAPEGLLPNFQSYIVSLAEATSAQRDGVIQALQRDGIASRRGLMAAHLEPCYRGAATHGPLTNTVEQAARTLLLPIFSGITEAQQRTVAAALLTAIGAGGADPPG